MKKLVKSTIFEAEKPFEMSSNCKKFEKNRPNGSNQPFFEGEKSLEMGMCFRPQATTPPPSYTHTLQTFESARKNLSDAKILFNRAFNYNMFHYLLLDVSNV